ncbi:MAG: SUMF1/EgtB/PvdO family nonheme iron enzyme [Byssovorax sp.]
MHPRTASIGRAVGAGVALGVIGLGARYFPAGGAPFVAEAAALSARAAPLASPSIAAPVEVASASPSARPLAPGLPSGRVFPVPRAAVYDADPASRAACADDMALVDGDYCPRLEYACLRKTGGIGCAEYVRGQRCLGTPEHRRFCVDRYEWPNKVGENPMVYVDWHEAKALCAQAGKRLCRRSEWTLACEGPKRLPFPWGFVRAPSPCNIDRASIAFDVNAMIHEPTREEELARLWQADRIGSHPDCVSAYGAYDLAGNVDEWTDDQADNPASPHPSTLNGGYWGPVRDTCRLTTTSHGPTFKFYQVGFRCCGDAKDEAPSP